MLNEQAHALAAPPALLDQPLAPGADYFAERILSMWGAMCTAYTHGATGYHDHWTRSIRVLGKQYTAARVGR